MFSAFNTEGGYDFVRIINDAGPDEVILKSYTGDQGAFEYITDTDDAIVQFTSDPWTVRSGFQFTYDFTGKIRECLGNGSECFYMIAYVLEVIGCAFQKA